MQEKRIQPPRYAQLVLEKLEAAGFQAYLVGGCVRDMVLGKRPKDWDACTDALPEQVLALFPNARPTGLRHGTVTVCLGRFRVEVTTFRTEGGYGDHRRPDAVSFIGDLRGDLERRDFTINAMARSLSGEIEDPFGGRKDLQRGLIRCVGEPEKRFEEDALRMFRALRFSARLGFAIEDKTCAAIKAKSPLTAFLAVERVQSEMEEILLSAAPETLYQAMVWGLLDPWMSCTGQSCDLTGLKALPGDRLLRWSAFCGALVQSGWVESPALFLKSLRMDNHAQRCCGTGAALAVSSCPQEPLGWKRLLARYGSETALCAAAAADLLYGGGNLRLLRRILNSGECVSLAQLQLKGGDLAAMGFAGEEIGRTLETLLDLVLEEPERNSAAELKKVVAILKEK